MKTDKTAPSVDLNSVRTRLVAVQQALCATFAERHGAIQCIMLGALTQSNSFLVGPPGAAKSAIFDGFLSAFSGARKFSRLVTKFGTEDEYFGPVRLSALKEDRWERNLTGRMAGVEVAFLDEVFKGSDAVLNTLLTAMNERTYQGLPIPLRMVVGASNELPEEESLAPMYDRFLLRDVVDYIDADATWMALIANPPKFSTPATISLAEWDAVTAAVKIIPLSDVVIRELLRIKTTLKAGNIIVSDRRWIALSFVLRAAAWLDDAPEVELDHLSVLRYGLWKRPEERSSVDAVLRSVEQSTVVKAIGIIDKALALFAKRPVDPEAYDNALSTLADAVTKAAQDVDKMLNKGVSRRAQVKIQPKVDELKQVHAQIKKALAAKYDLGVS